MVVFVPVPEIVPGLTVQFPEGSPVSRTLPIDTVHVSCVIKSTVQKE